MGSNPTSDNAPHAQGLEHFYRHDRLPRGILLGNDVHSMSAPSH
jgi:hypothetical protein